MNADDKSSQEDFCFPKPLIDFNQAEAALQEHTTLVDLFEKEVKKNPDNIALVFKGQSLTYQQLDDQTNALANYLTEAGVKKEMLIPICIERSLEMIIGIIGIMKSGAAYVPLDPSYPQERIRYINEDINASFILTTPSLAYRFEEDIRLKTLLLNHQSTESIVPAKKPSSGPDASHVAYVIYTSGSTGKPKGVLVEHHSVVNFVISQSKEFQVSEDECILQTTNYAFDPSVEQIFLALCNGARLILIQKETLVNPRELMEVIQQENVTHLHATPALLQQLTPGKYGNLKRVISAGDICPPVLARSWSVHTKFYNKYGPTETTISSIQYCYSIENDFGSFVPIGKPIANTEVYIVDEEGKPLGTELPGEIYIGGAGVTRGYLNRPELTAEKFIVNPFSNQAGGRLYKSGDIGRWLPDGNIEFLGRKDDQIKIHGHRVEPGEIEYVLGSYPNIQQCIVVAQGDDAESKRLVAYIVSREIEDSHSIKNTLADKLPGYMLPSLIIQVKALPLTANGKIDKKALPKPSNTRPDSAVLYRPPFTETEKNLETIWRSILQLDKVGIDDNFFDLGGNSLLAVKTITALKKEFEYDVPVTWLYNHPTIQNIASLLSGKTLNKIESVARPAVDVTNNDVAVIGMAGRFPGANTIKDLWHILQSGKETTHFFTADELDPSIPDHLKNDPNYIKARGVIDKADEFDALFFGINAKLAELMDPQHRIFLEIAWEALESSGYKPQEYNGSIGVFAGCRNNMYYYTNVLSNTDLIEKVGSFQVMIANEKDYIATRTAYSLDLKGPAVNVQSACSTSLLAIAQAVQSIRLGQCDMALAGGAAIALPINSGYSYQEGAMLSNDGHCRPFDAGAQGTVFSDGAGVVLLKNMRQAEKDGDLIYAVIKGVGINNDGGGKSSFTAPSSQGQAGAIDMAIKDAGIDPLSVSFIEAHGTATPLGDPIEIEGLNATYGIHKKEQHCAIGSIKSNMGHLTVSAGVAGFIKTTLSLFHKQLAATLFYKQSNPNINFNKSNFYVNTSLKNWDATGIRRAGVSAFGVGGTNVHIILEESVIRQVPSAEITKAQLLCWSAKTENSRDAYTKKLAAYLDEHPNCNLADLTYSFHLHKQDFNARRFIVAGDYQELLHKLQSTTIAASEAKLLSQRAAGIVFMFPGQGSQYVNMGKELYEKEQVFRDAVEECFLLLKDEIEEGISNIIYPGHKSIEAEEALMNTRYAQPALFIIEYATARLWMSWGILPSALVGHSIGEFVAAHLAGVFSLADALKLIATRGLMMSELPRGSMLSVRIEESKIRALLPQDISLAAINSPGLCVVAGPDNTIASFARLLDEKGIINKLLHTSHAFHSSMMEPILEPFEKVVSAISLNKPSIPVVSTVTGNWLTNEQATDSNYWASHLRNTVRFADAIGKIVENPHTILLEAGPRNVTSILARQQTGGKSVVISSFEPAGEEQSEYNMILKALGQLWLNGAEPDWKVFYSGQQRSRINDLPTYAFDRKHCWVNPVVTTSLQNPHTYSTSPSNGINHPEEILQTETVFMRKDFLINKIKTILEDASGIEMDGVTPDMSFIEMGLDSLLLTQIAITIKKEFNLPVTFRQLNEAYGDLNSLAAYLDQQLPPEAFKPSQAPVLMNAVQQTTTSVPTNFSSHSNGNISIAPFASGNDTVVGLISQQLQILAKQVAMLQGGAPISAEHTVKGPVQSPVKQVVTPDISAEEMAEIKKPFGASARIEKHTTAVNESQKNFLTDLISRYTQKTGKSKSYNQSHRSYMADPRVVSGFKPLTKELVYSIVMNRSKGNRMWDVDGNEYIDVLNGFGSNMLGYQPDFITKAIKEQIDKGFEIGPQHELAGEVCKLICEFTNADRAALCSTGSEAVLGAMRIARTVTGRSLIVAFTGSYHGIVDEVIVRGTKKLKSFPAAPGIMPESVQNMLILDYGTDESLAIIRARAHEFAAVLVEPVQSRRPDFQPFDFLKELRKITAESGAALIFDEVITGFRMHPSGIQGMIGIQADLGTYGKVIGGGIPIGVIAGKKVYMDALDGGSWQYGDDSIPEAGVTYFAGTFVRHPLALAAAKASLNYMKEKGPSLQAGLNEKTLSLSQTLNSLFNENGLPIHIVQFGSLWKVKFKEEVPYGELLFTLMRYKGVHIWDLFPCFMTDAFTDADITFVIDKFRESIQEMIQAEIFVPSNAKTQASSHQVNSLNAPMPGAKLGKDINGNPAWFIQDAGRPGKYLQVEIN